MKSKLKALAACAVLSMLSITCSNTSISTENTVAEQPAALQISTCNDGSAHWEPVAAVTQIPIPVDITACTAAGLGAQAVADCVQAALEDTFASACIEGANKCCLDPSEWVTRLDHGVGKVALINGTNRWVFWLQAKRRVPGELTTVWRTYSLAGHASLSAAVAATVNDMHPPDCGEDSCPDVSEYKQVPMFGPVVGGTWPVMIVGWVDASK